MNCPIDPQGLRPTSAVRDILPTASTATRKLIVRPTTSTISRPTQIIGSVVPPAGPTISTPGKLYVIKYYYNICQNSKPSRKIGTAKRHLLALSWPCRDYGLNYIFLGIKLFCFLRQKAETFSICLKKNFVKPHKISTHLAYSDNCYFHFFFQLSD